MVNSFLTIIIFLSNILRAVMEKVDRMQEQMSNVSRDMEIPRKNQKDEAEMKNTFDGLISGLDTSKERISELKNVSVIPPKLRKGEEKKKRKTWKNKKEENIQQLWDSFKRYNICNNSTRKRKRERNILSNTAENLSKLDTDTKPQVQEAQRIPRRINTLKCTPN